MDKKTLLKELIKRKNKKATNEPIITTAKPVTIYPLLNQIKEFRKELEDNKKLSEERAQLLENYFTKFANALEIKTDLLKDGIVELSKLTDKEINKLSKSLKEDTLSEVYNEIQALKATLDSKDSPDINEGFKTQINAIQIQLDGLKKKLSNLKRVKNQSKEIDKIKIELEDKAYRVHKHKANEIVDLANAIPRIDSLGDITDVNLTNLQNHDIIEYNSVTSEWENKPRDTIERTQTFSEGASITGVDHITLDNTPTGTTTGIGTLSWNDTGTLNIAMGGGNITQQVGEEFFRYGKATSAISDTHLQLVYKTGTVGASGVITFAPAIVGITHADQILGIATEPIALNGFGRVTVQGVVRGTNTTGSNYGEVWTDNTDIYYNPVTGGLTKNKPTGLGLKLQVGTVINAAVAGSGSFFVNFGSSSELGGTDTNVVFGTLVDNDIIQYDSATQLWKNETLASAGIQATSQKSAANGYASLDGSKRVPTGELPTTIQYTTEKGAVNGYASLDSAGKVPITQLPSSIMEYKGSWNASTNSPTIADGTGDNGDLYRVSVAGTQNLGSGSITFSIGDFVVYNGSIWQRSPAGGTAGYTYTQIDQSGGAGDTYGILVGSINGTNKTFTVSYGSYVSGSLQVVLNGQLQTQGTAEDFTETTPNSGTFTFTTAPVIGDEIQVMYKYATSAATNADTLDGFEGSAFAQINTSNQFAIVQQINNTLSSNLLLTSGYSAIMVDYIEINSSIELEIPINSILEIT